MKNKKLKDFVQARLMREEAAGWLVNEFKGWMQRPASRRRTRALRELSLRADQLLREDNGL